MGGPKPSIGGAKPMGGLASKPMGGLATKPGIGGAKPMGGMAAKPMIGGIKSMIGGIKKPGGIGGIGAPKQPVRNISLGDEMPTSMHEAQDKLPLSKQYKEPAHDSSPKKGGGNSHKKGQGSKTRAPPKPKEPTIFPSPTPRGGSVDVAML